MEDLEYRTFSQLMASVEGSLRTFADNNLIKRSDYIKVARRVNSDLGIKINRINEVVLNVDHYRAELPGDFLSIVTAIAYFGKDCIFPQDIIHQWQNSHIKNTLLKPLRSSLKHFSRYSINRHTRWNDYQIDVADGNLYFNFPDGQIYLAYVADMVNEEGDLLVLDHPLVNPYYESAIRAEVLKDLWHNIDADTYQKFQDERNVELPKWEKKAVGIVTFPGYRKMKEYAVKVEQDFYNRFAKGIV